MRLASIIDDDATGRGDLPGSDTPMQRFGEQHGSDATSLCRPIDRRSGDQDHGNRVGRHTADRTFGLDELVGIARAVR